MGGRYEATQDDRSIRVAFARSLRELPPDDPALHGSHVLFRTSSGRPMAWVGQDGSVHAAALDPADAQAEYAKGLRFALEMAENAKAGHPAWSSETSLHDVLVALAAEVGRLRWELERVKTERS